MQVQVEVADSYKTVGRGIGDSCAMKKLLRRGVLVGAALMALTGCAGDKPEVTKESVSCEALLRQPFDHQIAGTVPRLDGRGAAVPDAVDLEFAVGYQRNADSVNRLGVVFREQLDARFSSKLTVDITFRNKATHQEVFAPANDGMSCQALAMSDKVPLFPSGWEDSAVTKIVVSAPDPTGKHPQGYSWTLPLDGMFPAAPKSGTLADALKNARIQRAGKPAPSLGL